MASTFTIKYTSTGSSGGKTSFSINPGAVDTTTSLLLPGDGKTNYGEFFNENLVHMLENFAGTTSPINPTSGQLWYNPTSTSISVYNGSNWLTLASNQYTSVNFVHKTGDTLTGPLILNADPLVNLEAATKHYVDVAVSTVGSGSGLFELKLPIGCIILWSGSLVTVPVGWHICDGTNGTPDLQNKFVLGASSTNPIGTTGGSSNLVLSFTTDSHTLTTDEIPFHHHNIYDRVIFPGQGLTHDGSLEIDAGVSTNLGTTSGDAGGGLGHTHGINQTITTTPPFYALAYIMKVV